MQQQSSKSHEASTANVDLLQYVSDGDLISNTWITASKSNLHEEESTSPDIHEDITVS